MRRTTNSWLSTIAKLGFKKTSRRLRSARRYHGLSGCSRLSRVELLEDRHMLTATVFDAAIDISQSSFVLAENAPVLLNVSGGQAVSEISVALRTIDAGESYWHENEQVSLLRLEDEIVVGLHKDFANATSIESLVSLTGPLNGWDVAVSLATGRAVFKSTLGKGLTNGGAADALTNVLTSLSAREEVAWSAPVFYAPDYDARALITNEIVVSLENGISAEEFFDSGYLRYHRLLGTPDQYVAEIAGGAGTAVLAWAEQLRGDSRVSWASPNVYSEIQSLVLPNDTLINNQWHLENTGQNSIGTTSAPAGVDAHLSEAWDETRGDTSVTIAVLDDGVQLDHPDFNIWINQGEIPAAIRAQLRDVDVDGLFTFRDLNDAANAVYVAATIPDFNSNGFIDAIDLLNDGDWDDDVDNDLNGWFDDFSGWDFRNGDNNPTPVAADDDHGTAVAGVAGARGGNALGVSGAAQNSRIMPIKISGDGLGFLSLANIATAVYYAAGRTADGMGTWKSADILNNSWVSSLPNTALTNAFNWASESGRNGLGAPVLAASGNSANNNNADSYVRVDLPSQTIASGTWSWVLGYQTDAGGILQDDTVRLAQFLNTNNVLTRFDTVAAPAGWSLTPFAGQDGWVMETNNPARAYGTSRYQARATSIGNGDVAYIMAPSFLAPTATIPGISAWLARSSETTDTTNFYLYNHGTQLLHSIAFINGDAPPRTTGIAYPASLDSVIAVGASTDWDYRANYSQFGTALDIVAPSGGGFAGITTADRTGNNGYNETGTADGDSLADTNYTSTFTGTSSATPLAAGIAALMLAKNSNLTADQVQTILQNTANEVGGLAYPGGRNDFYGHGRVNADAALEAIAPTVIDVTIAGTTSTHAPFHLNSVDGSGDQIETVPVGGANQVSVRFSTNVGFNAAAQNTIKNAFTLENEQTDSSVSYDTFSWNVATNTATWTFAITLTAAPYVLRLDDAIADATGMNLDGDWTNPTNVNQTGTDTFSSGNGQEFGDFEFFFTNLPADFNHDNIVNGADLAIWQANYGLASGATQSQGDVDGSGSVNGSDFLEWQRQVGFDLRDWNAPGILMPTVTNIVVSGSNSQHAAYGFAAAMAAGTGQLTTIPVAGADTITIEFSEDVIVGQEDLAVSDLNDSNRTFTVTNFSSTARSATWTFEETLSAGAIALELSDDIVDMSTAPNALDGSWDNQTNLAEISSDKFTSGDGSESEAFGFYLTSLPADFNRDNIVNGADQQIWSANYGTQSGATQSMGDTDGDGDVDGSDFLEWQRELGMVGWQDWAGANLIADPIEPMTILVSTLVDEMDGNISAGDVSLREALALAAQYDGADIIVFDPSLSGGTITLHNNLDRLLVNSDVEIRGLGADQLTINGGGSANYQGVFLVDTGVEATIRDLKITGGYAMSGPSGTIGPYNGGGVYNRGDLTLDHVLVTGNTSYFGGGIAQETSGASLTIRDSTISNNYGYSPGGGLFAGAGTVEVVSSTIAYNSSSAYGGGIFMQGDAALTLKNSTLSNNQKEALRVVSGTAVITNCTITNNTDWSSIPAAYSAGGVNGSGGSIVLVNSIVAGNTGGDVNGTLNTTSHHNLIGNGSEGNLVHGTNSNQVGTAAIPINAWLAPLASNGGPTQTHLLQANSMAVNAGDNAAAASLTVDQRGSVRLVGEYVDLGAVETALMVTIATDENDGNYSINDLSLREAIALAAQTSGSDVIKFDPSLTAAGPTTITLSYDGPDSFTVPDQLTIGSNVTIEGPAANLLTVNGNNQTRVFQIDSGVSATIRGLRLTGGFVSGYGGAIHSDGALVVDRSEIDGNFASSSGGGIYASSGTLTVSNSTISNNSVYYTGGGIYIGSTSSPALIINSTVSTNTATYWNGGGIFDASSGAQIVNSTITANTALYYGTGAGIAGSGTKLFNSIVAGNTGGKDVTGSFDASSAYNLIGFDSNLTNGINQGTNGNQVGGESGALAIDARLTALAYYGYGATTKTHALREDSTAIDAGDNDIVDDFELAYDQRGSLFRRIADWDQDLDARVDIGAVELAINEIYS